MDNRLILTDENGQETEMEIVLTFDDEEHGRKYVLVKYPSKDEDDVFAFAYDDEGNQLSSVMERTDEQAQKTEYTYEWKHVEEPSEYAGTFYQHTWW